MTYYYCTCDPKRRSQTELGKTPYRRTKVDRDEVCLDCGFYAIACGKNLDPDKELRAYLMDDHSPPPEKRVKGGLSLANQRNSGRNRGKRAGKSEKGDLDL